MHDKRQVLFGDSYISDGLTYFSGDELLITITYELIYYYLFNNNNTCIWAYVLI